MHQRDEDGLIPGRGLTVALHSVDLHTLDLDLDPDQDPGPGLTLTPRVDPAPDLAPVAGHILAPPFLDGMGVVTDAHGQDPALVQDRMGTGAQDHPGLLSLIEEEAGKQVMVDYPTSLELGLAPLVAFGAVAQVAESHLLES